jgi:hypothetical protein
MAVSTPYRGTTFLIPETDEEDWGDEATALLVALTVAQNLQEFTSAALNPVVKANIGADLTIAAGGTITWTHNEHQVEGSAAPVTVDATTGISAGEADRQPLRLVGGDATNTVTIEFAGNCEPNGAVILGLKEYIDFEWDTGTSKWVETNRSH